jgi:hypothetical protein
MVRKPGGKGLGDDAQHVQPGELPGLDGGLALRIAEVRGHRYHRVADLLAEVGLGVPLQLPQDEPADLLGGEYRAIDAGGPVGAQPPLDRTDRPARAGDPIGGRAGQRLGVRREGHHRRRCAGALGVRDDRGPAALHDGDHAAARSEVYSHRTRHDPPSKASRGQASHPHGRE